METKNTTLEAPAINVLTYGFSLPKDIGTSNVYCTDRDPAMLVIEKTVYLAYKEKGKTNINLLKGTVEGGEITWAPKPITLVCTIPGVVCHTDDFPSLTYYKGRILVFWKQPEYKNIDYGFLNIDNNSIEAVGFIPDNITSKHNAAVVAGDYQKYFTFFHLGKESDKIIQAYFDGSEWQDDNLKYDGTNQESKFPPQICYQSNVLHLIHNGKNSKSIYYSKNSTGLPKDWTKNIEIKTEGGSTIKTDCRPGLGIWKGQYLVTVYRDNDFIEKGFRLAYMDLKTGIWQGNDYICIELINSDHAPALSGYSSTGRDFICMAWSNRGSSGRIQYSTSNNIL